MYSPKLLLKDRWVSLSLLIIATAQAIMWWYTVSRVRPSDQQFFLHSNIIFGVDLVGAWWKIYLVPTVGAIFLILNALLAWWLYRSDRLAARLVLIFTIVVELAIGQGLWRIIGLNI